jgi:hypothetical protein
MILKLSQLAPFYTLSNSAERIVTVSWMVLVLRRYSNSVDYLWPKRYKQRLYHLEAQEAQKEGQADVQFVCSLTEFDNHFYVAFTKQ